MKSTMYLQKDWNLILDGDHRKNHQQDETHNAWSFPMYLQKDWNPTVDGDHLTNHQQDEEVVLWGAEV